MVARPIGTFRSTTDYQYQTLRCNVDLLKIIQLGLTFSNDEGELAPGVCTYQFNFKFSLNDDIYAQDSIDLLTRSGIDFRRHEDYGIDVVYFAELFIASGCVLSDDVKWVSFHSGYDFGYLIKLLTCSAPRMLSATRAGPRARHASSARKPGRISARGRRSYPSRRWHPSCPPPPAYLRCPSDTAPPPTPLSMNARALAQSGSPRMRMSSSQSSSCTSRPFMTSSI